MLFDRVNDYMQSLIDICIESAGELIRSNFGKDVIYEVVNVILVTYQFNKLYNFVS